ncbi:MAG: flagellar export protein FliJ [Oscillospiraceae bacterium]|nr:flagellar export protein FliJ [Oscillospiraceae bacterium]
MKKFRFSLASVLDYKEIVLEEKKRELAEAIKATIRKEKEIAMLEAERASVVAEFNVKKREGMTIIDAHSYEVHIRTLQKNIDRQKEELKRLREEEEKKKAEVVFARQEVLSLEKLKEQRVEEYNKAVMKSEELMIDEMVSNRRVSAASAQRSAS